MIDPLGDGKNFDQNWKRMKEANYLHWTRDHPVNQIQLSNMLVPYFLLLQLSII